MGNSLMHFSRNVSKSKVQTFNLRIDNNANLNLFVKRDDLIHNEISGNKWRKLKWNMRAAEESKCDQISTYGGAYSNHLLATASLGYELTVKTRGYVRGDELNSNSNRVLRRCKELNMDLVFLKRKAYDKVKYTDGIEKIGERVIWNIPEGGSNSEGVKGCEEIIRETSNDFDYIIVAQGTTTTSLGVLASMHCNTKLIVVPVLKGFDSIEEMKNLSSKFNLFFDESKVIVLDNFHFGGYAKTTEELNAFISVFNKGSEFQIEPIYTGKVMFALHQFLKDESIRHKKVLFVHTGGLYND